MHTWPDRGNQTVPDGLLGCWRRNWIRFGDDGAHEADVHVIWLQTASGMGDLRIDPAQTPGQTDSSCGITVVDETTTPHVTATWHDGEFGFAQQPVSRFPEPGWLSWDDHDTSLMYEYAPSGAYVEQWQKQPRSQGTIAHLVANDAATTTNLYIAGVHYFLAVRRSPSATIHAFSYGTATSTEVHTVGGAFPAVTVEASTITELVDRPMTLDYAWTPVSVRNL